MSAWKADKDLGPWNFTEQPNKWGYLNNPFWVDEPQKTVNYTDNEDEEPQIWSINKTNKEHDIVPHIPCGHWHKKRLPGTSNIDYNIYTLYTIWASVHPLPESITAVTFDAIRLKLILSGSYTAPDLNSLKGLDFFTGELLTTSGTGATTKLSHITTTLYDGELVLIKDYTPFNQYDVLNQSTANIIHDNFGKYYYIEMGSGRIVRLDENLVKESRGIHGTVSEGSDVNLYYNNGSSGLGSAWNDFPINNPNWASWWTLLEDQLTDSPVTTRYDGDHFCVASAGSFRNVIAYNGKIYIGYNASINGDLRELNTSSFIVTNNFGSNAITRIAITPGLIHYYRDGLLTGTVSSINIDTFNATGNFSERSGVGSGTISIVGDKLICSNRSDLIKINTKTYEEEISKSIGQTYTDIYPINDRYAVGTYFGNIDLIDTNNLSIKDTLNVGVSYSRTTPKETIVKIN